MSKNNAKHLVGKKFGMLIVVQDVGKHKDGNRLWECQCECGGTTILRTANITTGAIKSCGCLRHAGTAHQLPMGDASFNQLYGEYKGSAKKKNRKFELTKEQFRKITSQDCAYCGSPPKEERRKYKFNGGYNHNGIDRIDNSKGYVIGNCAPCCFRCNFWKRNFTRKEFLNHITKVYERCCK